MKSIFIEIFSPNHLGNYPSQNIVIKDYGYFVWENIPFFCYDTSTFFDNYHTYKVQRLQYYSSILLERLDFPIFCFSPFSILSINILINELDISLIYQKLEDLFSSKYKIVSFNYNDHIINMHSHKEHKIYCSQNEFINYQCEKVKDFKTQIEMLSGNYEFSSKEIDIRNFSKRLEILSHSSRLLNIALHYFVNASRLISNNFIEDAGINLNMVLEAILKDFMFVKNIQNKKVGIDSFNKTLKLTDAFVEWLEELYTARNEFLAHIDENMFTFNERINDPDSYCYEHYGSLAWLILKYFYFRRNKLCA